MIIVRSESRQSMKFRPATRGLSVCAAHMQEVYPQMSEGLLVMAGAALLSHDEKAPPGMASTKDVTYSVLLHITGQLTKIPDFAFPPVRQALSEAKQAPPDPLLISTVPDQRWCMLG